MPTSKSGSSSRRSGGSTRKRGTSAAASPEWDPVIRGAAGIIPGEVLLTLQPDAADSMTSSVPLHPAGVFGAADNLGVDDLDGVLAELGAHDITRLAPSPVGIAGVLAADGEDLGRLDGPSHILSRTFRVRISAGSDVEEAVARLAQVDSVELAEPNRWRETMITPNDPQFGNQWGLTKINAPAAWDISTGSGSVVVGIVDSGCDLDHPELAPLLVSGYDMVDLGTNPTPPAGWRFEGDFSGRDAIPEDEVGHGTHVAGTIAALSNNGVQVAGVGWQTKIMPVKALTRMVRISDGRVSGVGSSADVAAAVRWAADHGAHVINMSLGADAATTVESSAIAYAIGKGVVVVAAMGNDGTSNPSYPAAYPGVVAVGAIDSADKRASFSQTGSHISLVAPGVGILSTYLAGGTTTMSGTSMATPHVAGVAALIKAVKPSATGAEIADILRDTARPLKDAAADPVPNNAYGHGCLDAQAALVKARGPVINPTITIHLRTPIIACPPKTLVINQCPPHSLFQPFCPPKTIKINECGLLITKIPAICPPVTITRPPTTVACRPPPSRRPPSGRRRPDRSTRGRRRATTRTGCSASSPRATTAVRRRPTRRATRPGTPQRWPSSARRWPRRRGECDRRGGCGWRGRGRPGRSGGRLPALPAVLALLLPTDRHRAVLLRAADGPAVAVRTVHHRHAVVPGRDPHLAATDHDHAVRPAGSGRLRRGMGLRPVRPEPLPGLSRCRRTRPHPRVRPHPLPPSTRRAPNGRPP